MCSENFPTAPFTKCLFKMLCSFRPKLFFGCFLIFFINKLGFLRCPYNFPTWLIYDLLFFVLWIIPFDIIVFIFKKLSVLYVKSHYLEFEEETDEEIEQDIADDPEDHNDNIPYAEESDFEDDTIYTEERKPIPKIIPKKKKAPFNVEAFAKECNAYVVKQERQEEQENLQH